MNFTIVKEQRDFFRKKNYLECEEIFSEEEVSRIAKGVETALTVRLKLRPEGLIKVTAEDEFAAGHDLWRVDPTLKKILLSRNLAEIAGELNEKKPVRFGYDFLLPAAKESIKPSGPYHKFLHNNLSLNEMSCIQGVMCGAMLCVSQGENSEEMKEVQSPLFSKVPGHVVFFSPEWKLPLADVLLMEGYCYLMFVYVNAKAVYYRQEMDPHLHDFRQLGYQFGDKLIDTLNPVVYL